MSHRILMHVEVDARDDRQAFDWATKLGALLKNPMVRMAIEGEGIRLTGGDGRPVVYQPERRVA
jgi:hypothetical protein